MKFNKSLQYLIPFMLLVPTLALATVQTLGTRFIYPASASEITINLTNSGSKPALVQSWFDLGNTNAILDDENIPFMVLPVITRIDVGMGQTLRIMSTGEGLPTNKESLIWLNILDVPPKSKSLPQQNQLKIALRSRFKVFYRPDGLMGTMESAMEQIEWVLITKDNELFLQATNPNSYYVTFTQVKLHSTNGSYSANHSGSVPPFSTLEFSFPTLKNEVPIVTIESKWLNENGSAKRHQYIL